MILPKTKLYTQIITILILFLGVGTLVFGFFRIRGEIFTSSIVLTNNNANNVNSDILALQQRDSDGDGLSDYEETYIYHTSPYLADTDSDGISDADEIKQGKNPICPEGQNCQNLGGASPLGAVTGGVDANTNINTPASSGESLPTPQEIRNLLTQAGIPASTLQGLDDQSLVQLYQETIQSTGINPTSSGNTNGNVNSADSSVSSLLSGLSVDQIRALLQQLSNNNPTLSDQISKMSDADLRTLAAKILTESAQAEGSANANLNTNGKVNSNTNK